MPHRVAAFLRTSTDNISHIKKAAAQRSSRNSSRNGSRNGSVCTNTSTECSDSDDNGGYLAVRMPDLGDSVKKHRLTLPFGRSSKNETASPSAPAVKAGPLRVDWSLESPPIVLHGSPSESTGALLSGLMFLDISQDEAIEMESFVATLTQEKVYTRSPHGNCDDCQTRTTELKRWNLLANPTVLRPGRHQFPFSTLLDGSLPATTDAPLVSISYTFCAEPVRSRSSESGANIPIKFVRAIEVKRSLSEPLYPHHSVRIFPPTNIKASAHFTSVIHPRSDNTVTFKLDGLMTHNEKVKTVDLWKLKRVTWKLEETIKVVSPRCERHAVGSGDGSSDDESGLDTVTETRVLGEKQLHDGWKSDYSGSDGTVDLEFDYGILRKGNKEPKYACDIKTFDKIEVSHALAIELIVSKEFAQEGKTHISSQTGTGRILRMQFAVTLTENPGLGVSWDEEAPPIYEDVPPSPPSYGIEREPPIEYDDLEALDAQRTAGAPDSRRPSHSLMYP